MSALQKQTFALQYVMSATLAVIAKSVAQSKIEPVSTPHLHKTGIF